MRDSDGCGRHGCNGLAQQKLRDGDVANALRAILLQASVNERAQRRREFRWQERPTRFVRIAANVSEMSSPSNGCAGR